MSAGWQDSCHSGHQGAAGRAGLEDHVSGSAREGRGGRGERAAPPDGSIAVRVRVPLLPVWNAGWWR